MAVDYDMMATAELARDAFFVVEQEARARSGYFVRFNGSAGIWRKTAIADAVIALLGEAAQDALADPQRGVRREAHPALEKLRCSRACWWPTGARSPVA